MTGHALLAIPGVIGIFYAGLCFVALGTGLLKPNISSIIGDLYPEKRAGRDAGFSIFFMGIRNINLLDIGFTPWVKAVLCGIHKNQFIRTPFKMKVLVLINMSSKTLSQDVVEASLDVKAEISSEEGWIIYNTNFSNHEEIIAKNC